MHEQRENLPEARYRTTRNVSEIWTLEALLELQTPCHIGGPDADAASEQPLLRDVKGRPFIPGTSLAGVFRARLEQARRTDWAGTDWAELLFGHGTDTEEGKGLPSRLKVDDARLTSSNIHVELRQGVAIQSDTGIAADQQLYDIELLAVGTRFLLRLELELPSKGGDSSKIEGIKTALLSLLMSLEEDGMFLGKRTQRGYGHVRVVPDAQGSRWRLQRHNLAEKSGMLSWLLRGRDNNAGSAPLETPANVEALASIIKGTWKPLGSPGVTRFHLHVVLAGSILIRSGGRDPYGADAEHLHRVQLENERATTAPILSGTSLAGVLRHQCLRIARSIQGTSSSQRSEALIDAMFGKGLDRRSGHASKLRVSESTIKGSRVMRHTRVRIDPWTGGALETFLFTNDVCYGGEIRLELSLRELPAGLPGENFADAQTRTRAAQALLLLALRDLVTGLCPVGGEGGTGRGWLQAPPDGAFLTVHSPPQPDDGSSRQETIRLLNGALVLENPKDWQDALQALRKEVQI